MSAQVTSPSKASRNLVFSDGSSHKFWKIELDGTSHTVTFGRIGTAGQTQTKDYGSEDAARKAYDKLVAEKTKKGYADAAGGGGTATAAVKPVAASSSTAASGTSTTGAASTKGTKTANPSKKASVPEAVPESAKVETPKVEAMPAPAAQTDVDLSLDRVIDLAPEDWFRAGFRSRPPLERGAPGTFDKNACLERLAKLKTTTYGWDTRWSDLNLPPALSAEEAHFWLVAMTEMRGRDTTLKVFAESISKKKVDGKLSVADARKRIEKAERGIPDEATLALANLFSVEEYLELLLEKPGKSRQPWQDSTLLRALVDGFNKHVIPYLTTPQREAIRKRIRKNWDPHQEPASDYECFPVEYYVAAAIGMHDAVYEVTSHWADDRYQKSDWGDHYQRPQELVFGLGSAEIVAAEWRRLKLKMRSADDVRAFLACTECAALDCVAVCVIAESNKEKCEELLKTLTLVRAPEAAEPLLECKLSAKTPAIARDWLDRNVGRAVAGLIDTAGGRGKLADAATEYLRGVKSKGYASVIAAAVKSSRNSDAAARVQAEVLDHEVKVYDPLDAKSTPKWLTKEIDAAGPIKRKALPSWAAAPMLPPLVVGDRVSGDRVSGDRRLSDEQVGLVLQLLAATSAAEKHPLLVALRSNLPKGVRDEFAWKLFQLWQEDGFPAKEKWAMGAIAHLGDDSCVLKLTPLIRAWPGESQHARAVFGLECLRAIGSSIALMQLAGIAQKLKFKGLKSKAEQFVTEIAKERGLTRDELEDRVVPDCGLDEHGRREFSFGPRSFSFVLGGDLKAMVRDESGKIRPNLPDPGAKDDPVLAAESVAEWKLLKKQIKEVATIQAGRLEQAMVTGRRWNSEDFETLLVRHPLMTHLAQKLIWGGFDAQGKRVVTFRVTEERDFADPDDDAVKLDGAATVGVVHPLELTDAERERWGEVQGDYEVVSPFAQLGRAVYPLEAGEGKQNDLQRFHGLKLVAPTLVFTLEKLGWIRGAAMDGGCFDEHSKQFPAAGVTAVIGYEGTVGMGYIDPNEMLTLSSIHFCSGLRVPSGYGWDSKVKMQLEQVPPIVISEVLADLQVLKSKAK